VAGGDEPAERAGVTVDPDGLGRVGELPLTDEQRGVQCAAVESFGRALAVELGPRGVRVGCLRSAGSPDAAGVDGVFDLHAQNAGLSRAHFDAGKAERTLLRRLPRLAEVAQVAAFLASDRASAMTGTITNITCGELLD
jgi:NAD(P)-dependent dehydrogenase (short-subunit alcohol dehydrogenase family)